jgi:hypothetical protein
MTEHDPPGHLGHPHPGDIPAHGLFVECPSALLSAIADLDRPCDKAARRHVYDRTRDLLFSHLCETMLKPAQGGRGSLSLDEIKEVRAALEETIIEDEAITSRPGWTATHLHDGPLEAVHDGPREPRDRRWVSPRRRRKHSGHRTCNKGDREHLTDLNHSRNWQSF